MKKSAGILLMVIFIMSAGPGFSQIGNVLKTVKNKSVNRVNNNIDHGIDKGLDAVEKGVKEGVKNDEKAKAQEEQKTEAQNADQPEKEENAEAADAKNDDEKPSAPPALEAYSKYDFIPGEKVIFYDDFSQENIGDFPALWNTNGSAEVVTSNLFPGKWMKFVCREAIWTDELIKLPDNYTVEFDIIPIKGEEDAMAGYCARLMQSKNARSFDHGSVPGEAGFAFDVEYFGRPNYRSYINQPDAEELGLSGSKEQKNMFQKLDQKYHIAIWVQKSRVRLYQNQDKLFDLPKAFNFEGVKMDRLRFEEGAAMVSNIRIAVGNPDTRNKLLTEGKLVTYGIYFDVNKDIVKPESYGTLKDIATVLNENPGVKVKILGFTDSDGNDAANLDLSKKRAAAVKAELVKLFAVDGSRLETDGMGEGQPVAANDTPANKALNRRVEFVKM